MRLTERDVELAVGADVAHPRRVVVALLVWRDQLALLDDLLDGHVRQLVEELGRRENQNAVLLGDEQKAVRGEADTVGNGELQRRREILDLVGDAVLVAVGDDPDLVLARADKCRTPCGPTAIWRASGTMA